MAPIDIKKPSVAMFHESRSLVTKRQDSGIKNTPNMPIAKHTNNRGRARM